jgi:hypothetical protein
MGPVLRANARALVEMALRTGLEQGLLGRDGCPAAADADEALIGRYANMWSIPATPD